MRHARERPGATTLREACCTLLVTLQPALAQAGEPAEVDTIHTVVVTGSRIRS